MVQHAFFELENLFARLNKNKDPLVELNKIIDWKIFDTPLKKFFDAIPHKSDSGRKVIFQPLMMFKILVLQSLYNLSDAETEHQLRDRLSFMRFIGLTPSDLVPDEKTIWLFRDKLSDAGLDKELFRKFDEHLTKRGFTARKGQIIDASFVKVPVQRNTRDENAQIKEGQAPADWPDNKREQKDTDARWAVKNGKNYFGYKQHIEIDAEHGFVREYEVTDASVHDSQVFMELLDEDNTSRDVWADSAYYSKQHLDSLKAFGYREHIQRKGNRGKALSAQHKKGNKTRAKVRALVEHVFGGQHMMMRGKTILRSIGKIRCSFVIGLRLLAYNMRRLVGIAVCCGR